MPTKKKATNRKSVVKKKVAPVTTKIKLTPKQELFAQLFASDKEFFGNGVQAYIEAYDLDTSKPNHYNVAKAAAARLLSKVNILQRIDQLLEAGGLNDQFVDKQLSFVILQNADFGAKVSGIREYNKLKKRISDDPALLVVPVQIVDDVPKRKVVESDAAADSRITN